MPPAWPPACAHDANECSIALRIDFCASSVLLRPALYQAHHRVQGVASPAQAAVVPWQVVGPVCESADDFGVHLLPETPEGLVAVLDVGAYGYTMASRYNGRALPAEVFLQGGRVVASRPRAPEDDWVKDRTFLG